MAAPIVCAIAMLAGCGGRSSEDGPSPITGCREIGGTGDTPGRFQYPRCIDHDADALWVIDKSARVQRIDPKSGACLAIFRMPEWELGKPTGFCVAPGPDKDGKWCDALLWIADTHYHRVMVYKAQPTTPTDNLTTPEPVASWGKFGRAPGEFIYVTDVLVTYKETGESHPAIDRIYVSEYGGNDRISIFNAAHEFLFAFGVEGAGTDPTKIEFNRPQSLTLRTRSDGSRELIVTDSCNHRIGRFTLDGKLLGWIGTAGDLGRKPGQFYHPYGLTLLPDGTAMVTELGGARAQRIDLDTGRSLGCFGEPGPAPGQILGPWAVTTLNDSVYLLDSANNRITAFPIPR